MVTNGCELCGDADGTLFLRARCHPTAPLMVRKEGDTLILSCYLPQCGREVARLALAAVPKTEGRPRHIANALATLQPWLQHKWTCAPNHSDGAICDCGLAAAVAVIVNEGWQLTRSTEQR